MSKGTQVIIEVKTNIPVKSMDFVQRSAAMMLLLRRVVELKSQYPDAKKAKIGEWAIRDIIKEADKLLSEPLCQMPDTLPQTPEEVRACIETLLDALGFCRSVIVSNGLYDVSEQMAVKKADDAIYYVTGEKPQCSECNEAHLQDELCNFS